MADNLYRFFIEYKINGVIGSWSYFSIPCSLDTWYTIEIEKSNEGTCNAWVYQRGGVRNDGDMKTISGFPRDWICTSYSAKVGTGSPYYLTNYYIGSYAYTDPNFVTTITYTSQEGFADVSDAAGWTSGGDVTFGALVSAEPSIKINGLYSSVSRPVADGDVLLRADFYLDNSISGSAYILGFDDGSTYGFGVIFNPSLGKFGIESKVGGISNWDWLTWDASSDRWYTIELEKGSNGKCAAWVYERGNSRNYIDSVAKSDYPTSWACSTLTTCNGGSFYLSNYYVGSYSQTTTYTDGSGRAIQTQTRNGTSDLVTVATYDSAGRADKQWRSHSYITHHKYDHNAVDVIEGQYGADYSYAQAEFERSPLSRILKQKPLGALTSENEHITYAYGSATIDGQECTYVQTRSKANSDVPWVITRNYTDKLGISIKTASYQEGQAEEIVTRTSYTMLGQPYQVVDPEELETTIQYDYLGRVTQKTTPDGGTSKYIYDKAGRLRFMADAVALATTKILYWKYDNLGRVTEKGYINGGWTESLLRYWAENTPSYPPTPATWRKQFTYGSTRLAALAGRLTKAMTNNDDATDVEVEELFAYDYDGNVTAKGLRVYEYDYNSRSALYTYDHLGRVKSMGYPSSVTETVTYGYDQLGRVVSVGDGTVSNAYAGYMYNSEGKLSNERLNNAGVLLKSSMYSYDNRGRIELVYGSGTMEQQMFYTNAYNGSISSTEFKYDYMTGKPGDLYNYTYNFHYDKYGRLDIADNSKDDSHDIGVGSATAYDRNGNIQAMRRAGVDKSYNLIDGKNQVLNTDGSGTDYQYDANGNMVVASARTTPVTLTYDVFTNMTMQVTKTSTGRKQSYQYDARNVRVMKTDDSTWSTLYLHGLNDYPLVEKTSTTERIYIYGVTGLIMIKEGSSKRYIQKDHLGSTRVLYDESGIAVAIYEYDAYGKCIARLENSQAHYRFTGQEYETESGLYNFRARMYFDEEVLFGQTDPANQTYAPYSYCLGNPIMFVDPTGREVKLEEERKRQVKYWEFMAEAEQWNLRESLEKTSSTSWAKRLFQVSYKNISYAQAWLKVLKSGHYEYERDGDETYEYPGTYSVTINQRVKPLWVEDDKVKNEKMADEVKSLVGKSYLLGADGPNAFDCSGTVCYGIRRTANRNYGDYTAHGLYSNFTIPTKKLQKGNLIFYDWQRDGHIDHVTTVISSTKMVHPSSKNGVIEERSIDYLDNYHSKQSDSNAIYYRKIDWKKVTEER